MPSFLVFSVLPRTARSVALASTPSTRRFRANSDRQRRSVAFLMLSRTALFADGREHQMHMGMSFIGVQDKGVPVLTPQFLPGEVLPRGEHLFRRCPRRHRKHHFVNQLWRPTAPSVKIRLTPMLLEIQIPVLEQILRHTLPRKPLAIVGLHFKLPVVPKTQVVQVTTHRAKVLPAPTQYFDHDFRRPSDSQ